MALKSAQYKRRHSGGLNEGQRRLATLLARTAQGDAAAFSELYAATTVKMRMTVAPLVTDRSELEDLMQEAYLKVWRNARLYDASVAPPITWMIRVMLNCAVDRLRRPRLPCRELDDKALSIADDTIDPVAALDRERQVSVALVAMQSLPPGRAELLAQAYLQGLSREVLARRYNVPAATIKTWIRRSLETVRTQMAITEPVH